eukprot:1037641-Amphidinium_carterae.1
MARPPIPVFLGVCIPDHIPAHATASRRKSAHILDHRYCDGFARENCTQQPYLLQPDAKKKHNDLISKDGADGPSQSDMHSRHAQMVLI